MKKVKIWGYIRGAVIANFVIMLFLIGATYGSRFEQELPFVDQKMLLGLIETAVRGTFIVFAAALIAKLVIDEFRSKSITVLFMYPISRKKLILAKLLIVVMFTFCSMIASLILLITGYAIFDSFAHILPDPLTMENIANRALSMVLNTLMASFLSLIPLYFGMRKYSGSTTIVSSLLVVFLVCQNTGDFTLYSIIMVPIALALLGAFIAYLTIRNIEHIDVN